MLKSLKQKASDYAGNRKNGAGFGWPSFTASLIEKAYLKGYNDAKKDMKPKSTWKSVKIS